MQCNFKKYSYISKRYVYACILLGALIPGLSNAVEPQEIKAGNFDLIPTITVDARDTDNMFLSNINEIDSKLYIVSPRLEAMTKKTEIPYRLQDRLMKRITLLQMRMTIQTGALVGMPICK